MEVFDTRQGEASTSTMDINNRKINCLHVSSQSGPKRTLGGICPVSYALPMHLERS